MERCDAAPSILLDHRAGHRSFGRIARVRRQIDVQLRESLVLAAVYITLASNLNLMLGYAGYINFGSIVFFGLGGYICVWLVDSHHWPLAASLLAAGIGVGAFAFIFGLGILRLRGPFFALSTIGIVEGVQAFVQNFEPWGGSSGIYISLEVCALPGGQAGAVGDLLSVRRGDGAVAVSELRHQDLEFGLGLLAIGQNEDAAAIRRADAALQSFVLQRLRLPAPKAIAGGSVSSFQKRLHPAVRRLRPDALH